METQTTISTVTGMADAHALGRILPHEHVLCCNRTMAEAFGARWLDRERVRATATEQFTRLREEYGVGAIVDATPINLGRDVELLREVSEASGVRVVASSGLYHTDEPFLHGRDPEKLAEFFVRECADGVEGTGVRPGVLKCASERAEPSAVDRLLLATFGIAQKRSGLPLIAHSNPGNRAGLYQLEWLAAAGADLRRVVIAHCSDTDDVGYIEALLESGCRVGIDRYKTRYGSGEPERRAKLVYRLAERGHLSRLLLSHDALAFIDFGEPRPLPDDFALWFEVGLPLLRRFGFGDAEIKTLFEDNPRNFLLGK